MGIIRIPTIFANLRKHCIERKKATESLLSFLYCIVRVFRILTCSKHIYGLHGTETLTQKNFYKMFRETVAKMSI
jgi:hypothetical protein